MTTWEYKIMPLTKNMVDTEKEFTLLGEDGWELVCILQHPNPKQFLPLSEAIIFAFLKKELHQSPKIAGAIRL
jgi:hypothetical protein